MKRVVQALMLAFIGGGALWLTFRNVSWAEFQAAVSAVRWPLFVAGVLLFGALHILRTWRWAIIVRASHPEIGFRDILSIASVGFLLINILPFRLGEFVRPYLLYERHGVSFGTGLATVVVERVLDVLALAVLLLSVVAFADLPATEVSVGGQQYDLVALGRTVVLWTLGPVGAAIGLLLLLGERGVQLAERLLSPLGELPGRLVGGFLRTFAQAVRALGSPARLFEVAFWTLATWAINATSMMIMAWGFDFGGDFGFWHGATVLTCVCVALIVPAPPGFAGVFELSTAVGLRFFGVAEAAAAAFGLLVHIAQFLLLAAFGSWFLVVDRISVRRLLADMADLRGSMVAGAAPAAAEEGAGASTPGSPGPPSSDPGGAPPPGRP